MDTRTIIDYAAQDNGNEFRNALYSAIHDKVTNHIAAAKQAVAQNLIAQPEEPQEESDNSDENN